MSGIKVTLCSTDPQRLTESLFYKEFNAFIPSNGHNGIPDMYAVAQYTSSTNTNYFRADTKLEFNNKIHPEVAVIEHLLELLKKQNLDSPNIKIYTSDAPCHECCQKLLQLLQTAKSDHKQDLEIEIVFSGLHLIKRPSCVEKNDCSLHLSQVSDNQHQDNVDGLKKLYNTRGVLLRPFTDQDWLDLQRTLWRPKTKDEILKRDFEDIMNFTSTSDQIKPLSQHTTDMSTQTSEPDESKDVGLEKARKRKRKDAGSKDERPEKKVKKQKEEEAKRGRRGNTSKRRATTSGRGRNISGRGGNISRKGGNTSKKGGNPSGSGGNTSKRKGNTTGRGGNTPKRRGNTSGRVGNTSRRGATISGRGGNTSRTRGNTSGRGGFRTRRGGNTSGRRGNVTGRGDNISGRKGNISRRGGETLARRGNVSRRGGNTSGRRGNVSRRTTTVRRGHTS